MSGAVFAGMNASREAWERMTPLERGRETLASQATLRDYFAAKALPVIADHFAPQVGENATDWAGWVAKTTYSVADAMLAAREAK